MREPFVTFEVPRHDLTFFGKKVLDGSAVGGTYGVLLPDSQFLACVIFAMLLAMSVGVVLAFFVHRFVIRQRGSTSSFLASFGIIIPTCVLFPYAMVSATGVRNSCMRFSFWVPFVLFTLRCLEAVFGYSPLGVEQSLSVYCLYFSYPGELLLDRATGHPLRTTPEDIMHGIGSFFGTLASLSIIMSLFSPFGYVPFESKAGEINEPIVLENYLDLGHLANSFLGAFILQLGGALNTAIQAATGFRAKEFNRNPMLGATSVTDFWSRRWNLVVHGLLKRGVYKPVRKFSTAMAATLAAFVISGLIHEWLIHVCFVYNRIQSPSWEGADYNPLLGSNMAFFVWNGITMTVEKCLGGSKKIELLGRSLPRPVVTFLIVMTSLPVAHWFLNPYIKCGFFDEFQRAIPLLTKTA